MLVCWADGTNDSLTKRLMLQVPFFIKSGKILILKIKSFDWPKSVRNYEKQKKKYLECQMLGWQLVCPIGPANQYIILLIDGFQIDLSHMSSICLLVSNVARYIFIGYKCTNFCFVHFPWMSNLKFKYFNSLAAAWKIAEIKRSIILAEKMDF